jgi:hypothetical protein
VCDYSLQGLPNRLAVDGEELVTQRFPTGSIGMASPVDIACQNCPRPETAARRSWWSIIKGWLILPVEYQGPPAVCIPPGTRLLISRIPHRVRKEFALDEVEGVTFVQLSGDPFQYRDALRFANGRQLLLQSLGEGVTFVVLTTCLDEAEAGQIQDLPAQTGPDWEIALDTGHATADAPPVNSRPSITRQAEGHDRFAHLEPTSRRP